MERHLHHPTRPPSSANNKSPGEPIREAPGNANDPTVGRTPPPTRTTAENPPNSAFTPAYSDSSTPLKFMHELPPDNTLTKEEKDFLVDLSGCDAIDQNQKDQLEKLIRESSKVFARSHTDIGCTNLVYHHVKINSDQPVYASYHKAQGSEIRKEINDQTQGLLASGVIKESESRYLLGVM